MFIIIPVLVHVHTVNRKSTHMHLPADIVRGIAEMSKATFLLCPLNKIIHVRIIARWTRDIRIHNT